MKEYKLSAKSKYSVLYLLSGLFMFFFMFAILNLSSYATGPNGSNNSVYPISYNFNALDWNGIDTPAFRYTISGNASFYYVGTSGSYLLEDDNFFIVTENGAINVKTHTMPRVDSTNNTSATSSFSYSGVCLGKPINAYYNKYIVNAAYGVWTYSDLTLTITPLDWGSFSSGSLGSSFSDYSNYSFVNFAGSYYSNSAYGHIFYPSGSTYSCSFPDYSGSSAYFGDGWSSFLNYGNSSYLFTFDFYTTSSFSSLPNVSLLVGNYDRSVIFYNVSSPFITFIGTDGVNNHYFGYFSFDVPSNYDTCSLLFTGTYPSIIFSPSYSLLKYKGTISDYMSYVQQNYNNITPSVTDLNQNTAQSVSDIGTAQTFETSAFTNFNNQFTSSGLDTFSLSFASTPLLWVSSIITTFYNNMPSTFQYLLMFVAFVGILCTVLNVFGRVAQRFGGGDSAAKLNSKDVFSKIEKNGSI